MCANQVLTIPSGVINHVYYVTDPAANYDFPEFDKSILSCLASYTNAVTPINTWITGVSDSLGVGKLVEWSTTDEMHVGIYTVTITAEDAICPHNLPAVSSSYTLEVKSQCWIIPIMIDQPDAVFKSPAATYMVDDPMIELEWSDLNVDTFTNPSVDCGPMEFLIKNQDGSTLESTVPPVFTAILDGSLGTPQFL